MQRITDVLVIGGGVIGLSTACELARAGRRVVLCDRGKLGQEASWAGAGIIPPGNPHRAAGDYEKLRAISSVLFAEVATKLLHETGIDIGYRVCGGIEFPVPGEEPLPVEAWNGEGIEWTRANTLTLKQLEAKLVPPVTPGYFLPALAQVRNPRYLKALIALATRLGVDLLPECGVRGYSIQGRRVVAADTKGGPVTADHYVVCGGAWSRRIVGVLRFALPLFPVRGQMVLLKTPTPIITRVILQGKRYIVPRDDGHVLVGSTEDYVGFNRKTEPKDLDELRQFAIALVPELKSVEVEATWAGLRPGTQDGLPFMGPLPETENVWVAAGHFRAGIQLSPATARIMAQLICGEEPIVPVEAFRLTRPAAGPFRPAFRS
jgi:glycine oxidase